MTFRTPIVRSRLAALIACSMIVTIVPLSAIAEQGIAPGSGAIVTTGQPLLVRIAPGWDAEVSYEIADGSYVTVWDVAQTAPDGTLWYPIDGGFVPVDGVTSQATLEGSVALYQEAAPEAVAEEWVEPAPEEWVEPAANDGWVDPNTGEWVEPAATENVEPAAEEWVEPAPVAQDGWVDPNTGEWVEPTAAETGWVDPNTGQWVEPTTTDTGWVDPNSGEWVEPTAAETGWVDPSSGQWVEPAAEEWVEPAPVETVNTNTNTNTGGTEPWGEPIGTAYISGSSGDGAVCRMGAERGTGRLAVLGEGEAVEVRGEAVGEWQPVNCAGVGGYVNISLIAWEPAAPVAEDLGRRGNRGNAGNNGTANSSGNASGNQVANFAMQYVGYPYAYAGEGPYAFDCSGFTKFVIQNTLGIDITHDMFTQIGMGQQVGMNELQPGDLVFFANTFRPGLSHTGVYIGGGQFVHAENEGTGVRVSDLNSDYYGSRWAGGTRIG